MATYCPSCYGRKIYCRKCKTAHCQCSWAKCPEIATKSAIKRAIKAFARQYPKYSTPKGAHDKCREASGLFCELLHKRGVKDALVDEISVVKGVAHKAVRIGDLWIDWTARQFDPASRWPKIENLMLRNIHRR